MDDPQWLVIISAVTIIIIDGKLKEMPGQLVRIDWIFDQLIPNWICAMRNIFGPSFIRDSIKRNESVTIIYCIVLILLPAGQQIDFHKSIWCNAFFPHVKATSRDEADMKYLVHLIVGKVQLQITVGTIQLLMSLLERRGFLCENVLDNGISPMGNYEQLFVEKCFCFSSK
jgi:hypothetical protein